MGYTCDVKILAEEKAYNFVMKSIKAYNESQTDGYVFKPHFDKVNSDGNHIFGWYGIKWYNGTDDVKSVTSILRNLSDDATGDKTISQIFGVEDPTDDIDDKLDGYRYKMVIVGEDNATEEETNDYDWYDGQDLYAAVIIEEPSGYKEL